jgi:hypothetical protein
MFSLYKHICIKSKKKCTPEYDYISKYFSRKKYYVNDKYFSCKNLEYDKSLDLYRVPISIRLFKLS